MNQIALQSHLRKRTPITTCFHCGEACIDHVIQLEQKSFCCEGCKMVYSILKENDLGQYYDLNAVAGISQRKKTNQTYAFLDNQETISKLISYQDEEKTRVQFHLPQIHCVACLWLLENSHRLHPGIRQARVDFLKKEVSITFAHSEVSLRALVQLLDKIGYPPSIQLNDLDAPQKPIVDKRLYYQLGLAGFTFGNIMLLSFPEYLGMDISQHETLVRFFGYLNIALSLPLVFYSGWDYLRSAWNGLRQKHLNIDLPISLGILALFGRSLFEILSHSGAGYLDSLAGLIFFLLIGKWFQQNTYAKLSFDRDYKSYFPIACSLKKEGQELPVTLDKIKPGDLIVIRNGELIPADSILKRGEAQIDYSFVTGESDWITKQQGEQLYAGGKQMGSLIEVSITKKVSNSYLTQLWNEATFSKKTKIGTVSKLADKVAGFFTIFILSIATITLLYWAPQDINTAINAFTAVLIIACPCAVALSIPFTFGNIIRLLARHKIFLKNIHVLERLAKINHIVFDKTGTITMVKEGEMEYHGCSLSKEEKHLIYSLTNHSTHPLSRRIKALFDFEEPLALTDFQEIKGQGISAKINGHTIRIGSAFFLQKISNDEALEQSVFIEIAGKLKGSYTYKGQYRRGLANLLFQLREWATVSLLSGDNDRERKRLSLLFESLHFGKSPAEKLEYIQRLQSEQKQVAMIGDGLNDAGALSQSNVGMVITEQTSNFTPACDIILDAHHFERLPQLFQLARQSIYIVYGAYAIALLYNIIGLSYAVQGALSPVIAAILMPISSISIVLFGVGCSTWIAYKKGFKLI